ncbi:hypothetical protein [Actinacidiphila yeochonensis]|uniref:hypothetical protein n=1 Tax=Actinacidiphila yeochonensis TaxID=89050 RepID=UPI00068E51CA|nr:hypothetical protein [Actinacidiphila yeochonensis]
MGEFSGIDTAALQQMTGSFKGDKDHLRDRASSYTSEFSRNGLDTSPLTEIVGICGWMDDQVPMLTRRYHLAIAADKPYPGHKGMISIDESMVGTTAQSQKDGKALADSFDKALDGGDDPDEDLFAELKAHADDADFLKSFYNQLGPRRLTQMTNDMADDNFYGRYGDHPDQAKTDRDIVAQTFGTYTKVAFEGQTAKQKQASWNKWFDTSEFPHQGFRADYITSLLPGGSQDKDFLVALGDRVFDEKDTQRSGAQYMTADGIDKGLFANDHYTQLFDALAANPEASGEWMDHNYDTMQTLIYPHGPWDLGQPPSRAASFAKLMKAGTIDLKSTDRPLAEKLTARIMMDNYRHQNGDAKDIHPYDPIDVYYGQLVTANWSDMVYGITSPVGNQLWGADATAGGFTEKMSQWDQKAFLAGQDPNRPGLEVGAPLWQALLNESARNATVAGQESALFDSFRTQITNEVGSAKKDTDEHAQDYRSMESGLMMKAYSQAFEYAKGSIEGDADRWADGVNSARDTMIDLVSGVTEAAVTGGSTAVAELGTEKAKELGGTAQNLMLDFAKNAVHVDPEDAPGLADKYKKINDSELDTSWQHNYQSAANSELVGGGFSGDVTAKVTIDPRHGTSHTYTGDPKDYIKSPADNFIQSDGTVISVDKMTPRQRTAYGNWLMDPAVVNHVDSRGFTQQEQFQHLTE